MEDQNNCHQRVLENTPKIKPNGNIKGVATDIKVLNCDALQGYQIGFRNLVSLEMMFFPLSHCQQKNGLVTRENLSPNMAMAWL